MTQLWIPKCPKCWNGALLLAPANRFTKGIVDKTEVYCQECHWQGKLGEEINRIYAEAV